MEKSNLLEYNNDIVIVGLGFVGLTLGLKLSEKVRVIGVEKDQKKVDSINNGIPHFHEDGIKDILISALQNNAFLAISDLKFFERSKEKSVFIITVGTPVIQSEKSVFEIIVNLLEEIFQYVHNDDIIIFRSTVSVGTTDFVYEWFRKLNKNVHVSFCPERTVEGNAFHELTILPQIISGTTQTAIDESRNLFSLFCNKILLASSTRIAELSKLSSNIERDVYFSFANELGFVSRELNLDFSELKRLVSTDYPRSYLKEVGPVAGPCLEKDTYILKQSFQNNFQMNLIETARSLNEKWIFRVCDEILKLMPPNKILCLTGLAFKGNPATDDLRGSLALPMYNYFIENNVDIKLFDPTISKKDIINFFGIKEFNILESWEDVNNICDLIVLQNGSNEICLQCKKLKVKFIDITSFNYTILNKEQRIF